MFVSRIALTNKVSSIVEKTHPNPGGNLSALDHRSSARAGRTELLQWWTNAGNIVRPPDAHVLIR